MDCASPKFCPDVKSTAWGISSPRSPGITLVDVLRKRLSKDLRGLIFRMVAENLTWGAPRIHGELLMLGFDAFLGPLLFLALLRNLKNSSIDGGFRGGDFSVRSAG
jgi:hypothetical protein